MTSITATEVTHDDGEAHSALAEITRPRVIWRLLKLLLAGAAMYAGPVYLVICGIRTVLWAVGKYL